MAQQAEPLTAQGIPRSLAPFLQEYPIEELDPERARDTLIERTLRRANTQPIAISRPAWCAT